MPLSRPSLAFTGSAAVVVVAGIVSHQVVNRGETGARSLSDSRFGEGERQGLLTIEDKSIKNNL